MRMCTFLLVVYGLLLVPPVLHAQWLTTPGNVGRTGGNAANGGYVCFRDGIAWAGHDRLMRSDDSGRTWQQVAIPMGSSIIYAIDFYDRKVGAVGTSSGLYATSDGGTTWKNVLTNQCWQFTIDRPTGDWYFIQLSPYTLLKSANRGTSWITSYTPVQYVTALRSNNAGAVFATATPAGLRGNPIRSTDRGATWKTLSGSVDLDSHEMIFDSCDVNKIYLMNEDIASTPDNQSSIFVSTDAGATFTPTANVPIFVAGGNNYTGGFSESKHALYAQLLDHISRSTDGGTTWKSVGGPGGHIDAQFVCAITDNVVLALDTNGQIWRTHNGGGDSITLTDGAGLSATQLFSDDTVSVCSTGSASVLVTRRFCSSASVVAVTIDGDDASDYAVDRVGSGSDADTVVITYIPTHVGPTHATVHVHLTTGEDLSVDLAAVGSSGNSQMIQPVSLLHQGEIGGDVTIDVGESLMAPVPLGQAAFRIYGHYDPNEIVYAGVTCATATVSANAPGDGTLVVDVAPQTTIGDVICHLNFLFYPDPQRGATAAAHGDSEFCTQIVIDSLTAQEGSSCIATTTTSMTTEICAPLSCGLSLLSEYVRQEPIIVSVRPNPARNYVDVASNLLPSSIGVIDLTGAVVKLIVPQSKLTRLSLDNLPSGPYTIELRTADGRNTYRQIIKN